MQMVDREPGGRSYQSVTTETPLTDPALIQLSSQHLSDFNEGNSLVTSFSSMDETAVAVEFAQRAAEECSNKHNEEGHLLWMRTISLLSLRLQKHELTAKANFELGKLLFERWERDSEAEEALSRSWESEHNPTSEQGVVVATMLGRVLIQNLKFNEALQLLSKAAEIGKECCPDSENTHTSLCYLSLALWKTNNEQEAAQLITLCRVQRSQNYPATISTALAFELSGQFALGCQQLAEAEHYYQTALTIFKTLCSNSREMAIVYITLGMMYRSSERWTEAESVYKDALETFREDNPIIRRGILSILGAFYETLQRYSEAQVSYGEALDLYNRYDPTSINRANALIQVGALRLKTMQYSEAELVFKEALDIYNISDQQSPYIGDIQIMLASVYETQHRYPEAEQTYQAALETYGKQASSVLEVNKVRKQLDLLYAKIQTSPAAERIFQETMDLNKDLTSIQAAHIQSLLGKVYQEKRKYQDAEQRYKAALATFKSHDPTSAHTDAILSQLGELYKVQECPAEAIQMYEAALLLAQTRDSMSIETGNILLQLALLDEREHRYLTAEQKVKEALRVFQVNNAAPINTGQALLQLGSLCAVTDRLKEAQWHFKAALALFPDPASPTRRCVLVKLGSVYDRMQLYRAAYKVYNEVLALYEAYDPIAVEVKSLLRTQGKLSARMNRLIEAEQHYNAALALYRTENPTSENTVYCFLQLGHLYELRNSVEIDSGFILPLAESKLLQDTEGVYRQAYKIYRAEESTSALAGSVLLKLCSFYMMIGLTHVAEPLFRDAFKIYRSRDPVSASTILRKLAEICEDKKQYEETEGLLQEAWELSKAQDPLSSNSKDCLETLAHFYERRQDFPKAQVIYTEALSIHKAFDHTSLATGSILLQVGNLYEMMQSTVQSETLKVYTEALLIYKAHDPNSLTTGSILLQIAKICARMQLDAQTESSYKEALSIYQYNDPVSSESNDLIKALGDLYEKQKRYQEAEKLYTDSVHIFKSANSTSKDTAHAMIRLAALYVKSGQYSLAYSLYTEALSICTMHDSPPKDTANVLLQLGSLSFKYKLYSTAERQLRTVLTTQYKNCLSNSDIVSALLQLGNLYFEAKSYAPPSSRAHILRRAKKCYVRLLCILKEQDPNASVYGNALMKVVALDEEIDQFRTADLTLYEDGVKYFKKNNPLSPEIERLLSKMGIIYENSGNEKMAENCYVQAFQRKLADAARPEKALESLNILVQFCKKNNLLKQAEQACMNALGRYQACHSPLKTIGHVQMHLGAICEDQLLMRTAEERYREAVKIFKSDDPRSELTGRALFRLGRLNLTMVFSSENELLEAFDIYLSQTPIPCDICELVQALDSLFGRTRRFSESEHIYQRTLFACEEQKPRSRLEALLAGRYLEKKRFAAYEQVIIQAASNSFECASPEFFRSVRSSYSQPTLRTNPNSTRMRIRAFR